MSLMTCAKCQAILTSREAAQGTCDCCGAMVEQAANEPESPMPAEFRKEDASVRPWAPLQIFAVSFALGSAAGGLVAAVNFERLGQRLWGIPMALTSVMLFLAQAYCVMHWIPSRNARLAGFLINIGLGLAYALIQKPVFDCWKEQSWGTRSYKPNGLLLLIAVGICGLVIELGVLGGMALLARA